MASVSLDPSFHFFNPLPLTLGCKNEKQPSGLTELDIEAGNLFYCFYWPSCMPIGHLANQLYDLLS